MINSYTLIQDVWELDSAKIRELASFDLACPSPSLELTVLDQAVYANGNVACMSRLRATPRDVGGG